MKNKFILLLLLVTQLSFSQVFKTVKVADLPLGSTTDSIVVWGADKQFKHMPSSGIKDLRADPFNNNTITPSSIGSVFTAPSGNIIREIGNVFFDDGFWYQTIGISPGATTDIYLLKSADLITWENEGMIAEDAEDSYIVKQNGTFFMYAEGKEVSPFHGIKLYTSTDLINWTDEGYVLDKEGAGWQSQDVSSPVCKVINGVFYLLYEGRSSVVGTGALGLATSTDGYNFTKISTSEPIYSGTDVNSDINWSSQIVPDDLLFSNGQWYLSAHVSISGQWYVGFFASKDLINWVDLFGKKFNKGLFSDVNGMGMMFVESDEYGLMASIVDDGVTSTELIFASFSNSIFDKDAIPTNSDYVDLESNQTVFGEKTFDDDLKSNSDIYGQNGVFGNDNNSVRGALSLKESGANTRFFFTKPGTSNDAINMQITSSDAFLFKVVSSSISDYEVFKISNLTSSPNVLFYDKDDGIMLSITNTKIDARRPIKLQSYTVSTLPSGETGMIAYVTDATSVTYRGVVTGGGSTVALVFYDGTNWIYN